MENTLTDWFWTKEKLRLDWLFHYHILESHTDCEVISAFLASYDSYGTKERTITPAESDFVTKQSIALNHWWDFCVWTKYTAAHEYVKTKNCIYPLILFISKVYLLRFDPKMNKNERMKFSNTLCKPLQKKSSKIFYLSNPFLPNVYFGFLMFSGKLNGDIGKIRVN